MSGAGIIAGPPLGKKKQLKQVVHSQNSFTHSVWPQEENKQMDLKISDTAVRLP